MESPSVASTGVAAGSKGGAAFYSYLKQPVVIARLQVEGFERANRGAPHPWTFLIIKPGVVSPAEKALCRSLTSTQRARIEANRASPRTNDAGCATDVGDTIA